VQVAELGSVASEILRDDPIAASWMAHLGRVPAAPGDRVLGMRRWLGRDTGEAGSPEVGACWLDVKRVYMELRPRLSRLYSTIVDLERQGPIFIPLGFAPLGDEIDLGGACFRPVWLEFGEGSVDGWLSRLIDAEVGAEEADLAATAVRNGLTRREVEVLRLIADGCSNREIGVRLYISERTAGHHVSNIFAKLGVHSRAQASRIAVERGLTT
jgi:DNA-binding CsgD family transcriptional regulator